MAESLLPLTNLREIQRTQVYACFVLLRPALEDQISQTLAACEQYLSLSTIQRWIKQYREEGEAWLANTRRSDKGKSPRLSTEVITLLEGLAEYSPPCSIATIYRKVSAIAKSRG
jgi:transposase